MVNSDARIRAGLIYGFGAYLVWGVMPIYFKALRHVWPTELVASRIVWSLVFIALLATHWRRWGVIIATARVPRVLAVLTLTAFLIAANWLTYVWAVVNGHVLEASLGYYLNPLVNVLLGTLLLKERLSRPQLVAVLLAATGVAVLAAGAGHALWISLVLATSFAGYGFFRKITPADALEGLSIETAVLAPVSLGWLLWLESSGQGHFGLDAWTTILLILSGIVTAVPLLWFNAAAKRLPLSTLGFLQYVAPTLQFLLAVAYGEHLTHAHLICFAAIWTALAIFIGEGIRQGRAAARSREPGLQPGT